MKNKTLFSQTKEHSIRFFRYLLFGFNLLLLAGLGVKTFKIWSSLPFELPQKVIDYPEEPEFLFPDSVHQQLWSGLLFESALFITGGSFCYFFLIKNKSIRTNIIAPFVIAFLLLSAESVNFFLPALDKARTIDVCHEAGLSWNKRIQRCNLMDIEKKRMEMFKNAKKTKK